MGEITQLLQRANDGEAGARDQLFSRVYAELQSLARGRLSRESTLTHIDAPGLVHEAWLRFNAQESLPDANRRAFFAYAASVMRSVIVDYVRARNADKRGSGERPLTLTGNLGAAEGPDPEIEALDSAMQQLAKIDARAHQVVEMRYFGGMSLEDIAEALDVALITVKRDWQKARAFLFTALGST